MRLSAHAIKAAVLSVPFTGFASVMADIPLALQLGLTPESLAVAGVSANETATVLSKLQSQVQLHAQLESQTALAHDLIVSIAALDEAQPESCTPTAREDMLQDLAAVKDEINETRRAIIEASTDELSPEQVVTLQLFHASVSRQAPAAFRVVAREDDEWKAIELALRAETRAQRRNEPIAEIDAQLLQSVRSDPAVTAAQANLNALLPSLQLLFDAQ